MQTEEERSQSLVLVLEDDLFVLARIESMLKRSGYEVQVVSDSKEAVRVASERSLTLIIVNFGSERLNPAEVVRQLKALPDPAPVLGFVPHKSMPQIRPVAMAAGCDLLVANSALAMRLPQLVERLINHSQPPL